MPRIPTVTPELRLSVANQPQIPDHYGTGPGRAVQNLGGAIGDLGSGLAAGAAKANAEAEEMDRFNANLEILKFQGEQDRAQLEYDNAIQGDGRGHADGRLTSFDQSRADLIERLPNNPKIRQHATLQTERMRNGYGETSKRYEVRQRGVYVTNKVSEVVENTLVPRVTGDINSAAAALETVDGIIRQSPGLPADSAVKIADTARAKVVDKWVEKATEDYVKGQGPDPKQAAETVVAGYLTATRKGASQGTHRAAQDEGMTGETLEVPKADVPRELPKEPAKLPPMFVDRTPTPSERRAIFAKGGVVVNLDTNWANGDRQTRPMVVIPDNASPEQRRAAGAYAARIADLYKQQFGKSLEPTVVTRSQNGRGRAATIHTEPYSVNDRRAVAFFSSPGGARAHAAILRETFGQVSGVHFSLPHDPYGKGDMGAAGAKGVNEVALARLTLAQMAGADQGEAPEGGSDLNVPAPSRVIADAYGRMYQIPANPTPRDLIAETLIKNLPAIEKATAKAREARVAFETGTGMAMGRIPFNKYDPENKKMVDGVFDQPDVRAALEAGEPAALDLAVKAAHTMNYVPAAISQTISKLTTDPNPEKNAVGYQIAGQILERLPHAFEEVDGGDKIAKRAAEFNALVTVSGYTTKEAILRMREFDSPEWKAKAEQRGKQAKQEVEKLTADDLGYAFNGPGWRDQPTLDVENEPKAMTAYKDLVRENYIRMGDADAAKEAAAVQMRRMWGTSNVTGEPRLMQYPPERFYKAVPNPKKMGDWLSGEVKSDHDWITKDAQRFVRAASGLKVEPGDITIATDARTQREISAGQPPSYLIMFKDDKGMFQMIPGARWYPDEGEWRKRFEKTFKEKREAEMAKRIEEDKATEELKAPDGSRPIVRPGSVLDQGIKSVFGQ